MRRLCFVGLLVLALVPLSAQQSPPAAQPDQPVFKTSSTLATLDAVVTDDQGRAVPPITSEEVFKRLVAGVSGDTLSSKTLRKLSLGRAGNKRTEEDVKEDIERYSFQSGEIPAGGVKEGLIYFEAPRRNKFTTNISLGDLWTRPLPFSTEKQK